LVKKNNQRTRTRGWSPPWSGLLLALISAAKTNLIAAKTNLCIQQSTQLLFYVIKNRLACRAYVNGTNTTKGCNMELGAFRNLVSDALLKVWANSMKQMRYSKNIDYVHFGIKCQQ
jgi:hypothetical protein